MTSMWSGLVLVYHADGAVGNFPYLPGKDRPRTAMQILLASQAPTLTRYT